MGTINQGFNANASTTYFAGQPGSFATFNAPDGSSGYSVIAINASGQVAGNYLPASGGSRGYTGVPGSLVSVDVPGATNTFITAFNNLGEVAGLYGHGNITSSFVGLPGNLTTFNIPGASAGAPEVTALNNAGEVAGDYTLAGGQTSGGFAGQPGSLATFVSVSGLSDPLVSAINASGEIAGTFGGGGVGAGFGFSGTPGDLTTFALPGTLNYITGLNASGEIAGYYLTGDGTGFHGFVATPDGVTVAEPASLALIGTGVAGLLALHWRRHGGHAHLA